MQLKQHTEAWHSYIDRVLVADPSLAGEAFDELMMELVAESSILELDGCDKPTMHHESPRVF